jgi:hypothetical protein
MTFPIYGKIKNVPNHQPKNYDELPFSFIIIYCYYCTIISVDHHEYSTEIVIVTKIFLKNNGD